MPRKKRFYPLSFPFYSPHTPAVTAFMPYDLFGEIPVTEDDIFDWVAAMAPRWLSPEHSYRYYVRAWDVANKIRAAKLAGTFYEITKKPARAWHARLALDAIV